MQMIVLNYGPHFRMRRRISISIIVPSLGQRPMRACSVPDATHHTQRIHINLLCDLWGQGHGVEQRVGGGSGSGVSRQNMPKSGWRRARLWQLRPNARLGMHHTPFTSQQHSHDWALCVRKCSQLHLPCPRSDAPSH